MSRVMVTGAAGFIGSNLTAALLERGYEVVGFDNLSQGSPRNMAGFADHKSFQFVQGDVRDPDAVGSLVEQMDAVVHLAAFKIPRYSNALETLQINSLGSRTVFRAAAKKGCRVVAASTSDVYGLNPELPFSEKSDMYMGPSNVRRWAYAVSKMYDEQIAFAFQEAQNLPVVLVRFFGGYGPGQSTTWWGGPQSVFINAILNDKPLDVHGDGQQTRSFTYISDHVEGLVRCLERDEAPGEVFNLGNTEEITILDLAHLIWGLMRGEDEPEINLISYSTFGKYQDVRRRVPNNDKAARLLGYRPVVSTEEGMRRTIEWQSALPKEDACE